MKKIDCGNDVYVWLSVNGFVCIERVLPSGCADSVAVPIDGAEQLLFAIDQLNIAAKSKLKNID